MSAVEPRVGDRFRLNSREWQVVDVGSSLVKLRNLANSDSRRTSKEALLHDRWEYLGNYALAEGYSLHKIGGTYYYKTPAGNVDGPPPGARWSEAEAIAAVTKHATENAPKRRLRNK